MDIGEELYVLLSKINAARIATTIYLVTQPLGTYFLHQEINISWDGYQGHFMITMTRKWTLIPRLLTSQATYNTEWQSPCWQRVCQTLQSIWRWSCGVAATYHSSGFGHLGSSHHETIDTISMIPPKIPTERLSWSARPQISSSALLWRSIEYTPKRKTGPDVWSSVI